MENFIDKQTGEKFTVSNYSISFKGGQTVYKYKDGKQILNPRNNNILVPIDRKGIGSAAILKSNDRSERIKMLRKRSKDHYQREIKPKKEQMNKEAKENFKN
mgnify:CR=1 FL=1